MFIPIVFLAGKYDTCLFPLFFLTGRYDTYLFPLFFLTGRYVTPEEDIQIPALLL
jgi:hypothetical protein